MGSRLVVALVFSVGIGYACGCSSITVEEAKERADVVFRGTITALRDSEHDLGYLSAMAHDTRKIAVFRVSRVWKGEVGETFEMPALEETSACVGFWPSLLKIGNDLLVYASRMQGHPGYLTNICSRTALAIGAKDFAELGPGEEPKEPREPKSKVPVLNGQEKLPDGASLLEAFIADTRYASVRTSSFEGEVSFKTLPLRGRIVLHMGSDGKHYTSTDLPGIGKTETGGDGTV
jgi:hypothetical protein